MVKDIDPGSADSDPTGLTAFDGNVYFSAQDATHGFELWKSDGTVGGHDDGEGHQPGLRRVGSVRVRRRGRQAVLRGSDRGRRPRAVDDRRHGRRDEDGEGHRPGQPVAPNPAALHAFDGDVYFSAHDGPTKHGFELWKSDGTPAGTKLVKDIWPGTNSSFPTPRS